MAVVHRSYSSSRRRLLKATAAAAATLAVARAGKGLVPLGKPDAARAQLPGRPIQGYPEEASGFPGDTITFRVATDAPQFRIDFYRQGVTLQSTGVSTPWLPGRPGDLHEPDQDWAEDATRRDGTAVTGWQGYPFTIPYWSSGVYIAMFVEGDGQGNANPNQNPALDTSTADARTGKALIVVKSQIL